MREEDELPEGWNLAALPEVAEIIMGQSPPGSTYNEKGDGLPFFQGKAEFGAIHPTARKWCTEPKKIAIAGDILISVRAPVGPTNVADRECAIGRGLAAIRPRKCVDGRLLWFALRLEEAALAARGTGSTFTAISRDDLESVTLALAPLAEQKRIVAKVEELLASVNAARDRLARVPVILKRFRLAVLAAACDGRLLAGDGGDWRETSLGSLVESSFYGPRFASSRYSNDGIPTLRTTDISRTGGIEWNNPPRLRLSREEVDNLGLRAGDIVVTRTGATIGKCAVYDKSVGPAIPSAYLIRFRLRTAEIDPRFGLLFLLSPDTQRQFGAGQTSVAQPNINARTIRSFKIRLPSLDEQREIVRRVDDLFALADSIDRRVAAATVRSEQLTQAVLAKAFRGELSQDPSADSRTC